MNPFLEHDEGAAGASLVIGQEGGLKAGVFLRIGAAINEPCHIAGIAIDEARRVKRLFGDIFECPLGTERCI